MSDHAENDAADKYWGPVWKAAFVDLIALARRLKSKGESTETGRIYGSEGARIMHDAGFTEDEATQYMMRVWMMVRDEPQA